MLHSISGKDYQFIFDDTKPNHVELMNIAQVAILEHEGEKILYDYRTTVREGGGYRVIDFFSGGTDTLFDEPEWEMLSADEYNQSVAEGEYFIPEYDVSDCIDRLYDKEVFERTGVKAIVASGHVLYVDCSRIPLRREFRLSDIGTYFEKGSLRNLIHDEYFIVIDDKVDCCNELVFSFEGEMDVYEPIVFRLENASDIFEDAVECLKANNKRKVHIE